MKNKYIIIYMFYEVDRAFGPSSSRYIPYQMNMERTYKIQSYTGFNDNYSFYKDKVLPTTQ